ncbi:MAG: matrixin family metalloprotease [Oligoflexia bacterium]|nr:matrixin family metalloprotease [Oligoflexia bacterium]MBF0363933.1 matrixin family metalloprotease [Oligoflexia bacterium]
MKKIVILGTTIIIAFPLLYFYFALYGSQKNSPIVELGATLPPDPIKLLATPIATPSLAVASFHPNLKPHLNSNANAAVNTNPEIFVNPNFCLLANNRPIPYTLGSVYQLFDITQEEFLASIEKAAAVWERVIGRKVFVYEPKNERAMKISMEIESNQYSDVNEICDLQTKKKLAVQDFAKREQEYREHRSEMDQALAVIERRRQEMNKRITDANRGTPLTQEEFMQLNQDAEQFNQDLSVLAQQNEGVNEEAKRILEDAEEFNKSLRNLSSDSLSTYVGEYAYNNNSVVIYYLCKREDLLLTLMHELGHALMLTHNDRRESIMYPIHHPDIKEPSGVDATIFHEFYNREKFRCKQTINEKDIEAKYLK